MEKVAKYAKERNVTSGTQDGTFEVALVLKSTPTFAYVFHPRATHRDRSLVEALKAVPAAATDHVHPPDPAGGTAHAI